MKFDVSLPPQVSRAGQKKQKDLSVIIVSYNTQKLLKDCLASLSQSLGKEGGHIKEYEIIVVDNASSDGSVPMVRSCYPQVRLIENHDNVGFAKANNQAIAQADGRYLLFLNPDTLVLGDAPVRLAAFLEDNPEVGMVTGKLLYPDGSFQQGAFSFPNLWMSLFDFFPINHRLSSSRLNGRYPPKAYRGPFEIDHPLGACMMARREAVEGIGGFCEDFFIYCEEIDLSIRMKKAGWKIYCQPEARIIHYGGQSTGQRKDRMFVELYRSRLLLFRKHYSPFFRLATKGIVGLGTGWEIMRAARAYQKGEITKPQYLSRLNACSQILGLILTHG